MKGASVHTTPEKLAKLLCMYLLFSVNVCSCGFKGDTDKVRLLKECEANIEEVDYDLRSVGHLAAAEGHTELLLYLIKETKFNFALRDRWGKSPLDEIQDDEIRDEFVNILKKRGAKKRKASGDNHIEKQITANFKTGEIEQNLYDGENLFDEALVQKLNQKQ